MSFRKPPVVTKESAEEKVFKAGWIDTFYQPGLRGQDGMVMDYWTQFYWWVHFIKIGMYTLGLSSTALKFWVEEQMVMLAYTSGSKILMMALGYAALYGVLYLGGYLFDVKSRSYVREKDFGSKWIMRYENRIWWARATRGWFHDMPVFEQLEEIGDVIAYEDRGYPGDFKWTDYWRFFSAWCEIDWRAPFWNRWLWLGADLVFTGFCTHFSANYYGLQFNYHQYLPPVTRW